MAGVRVDRRESGLAEADGRGSLVRADRLRERASHRDAFIRGGGRGRIRGPRE